MIIIYDKKTKDFFLYKDAGQACDGRLVGLENAKALVLASRDATLEFNDYIIGHATPTKSNRGGKR